MWQHVPWWRRKRYISTVGPQQCVVIVHKLGVWCELQLVKTCCMCVCVSCCVQGLSSHWKLDTQRWYFILVVFWLVLRLPKQIVFWLTSNECAYRNKMKLSCKTVRLQRRKLSCVNTRCAMLLLLLSPQTNTNSLRQDPSWAGLSIVRCQSHSGTIN